MDFPIKWIGEPHPEHEAFLRQDIIDTLYLEPGDDVRGLIFHTCLLTDDFDGPSIHAFGDPETGGVIAEYTPTTRWVTAKEGG